EAAAQRQRETTVAAPGQLVATAVDVFRRSRLHWIRAGEAFSLSVGDGMVLLQPDPNGTWSVTLHSADRQRQILAQKLSLAYAQGVGEDHVRRHGQPLLVNPQAAWRKKPASPKQLDALRRMRIAFSPGLLAGEASDLISRRIATRCAS